MSELDDPGAPTAPATEFGVADAARRQEPRPTPAATRLPRLLPTRGREDLAAHLTRLGPLPASGGQSSRRTGGREGSGTAAADDLIRAVELAGLVGRGGGAFPTARKLRAAAEAVRRGRGRALVVVNAMEGEPASAKDRVLLHLAPHVVLDGAVLVAQAVGASEVVVCVPQTPDTVRGASHDWDDAVARGPFADVEAAARSVSEAIAERRTAANPAQAEWSEWDSVPISVARPPDRYVSGEGTALARWLGGGPALPAFSRVRLAESGVGGAPTVLDNAETLAHIALIARFGAGWFRSLGTETDPGTALVTVSGAVNRPGVAEIPIGATLGQLLHAAGGPSEPLQAVLVGGYGGTWVPIDEALGQPLVHCSGSGRLAIGPGIVVALPAAACGLAETARVARYMAGESAGQCGPCVYGLPALAGAVDALAHPVSPAAASSAIEQISRWGEQIDGRGACHHPDGVVRFVRSAMTTFADDVLLHSAALPCSHLDRAPMLLVPHQPSRAHLTTRDGRS